MEKSKKKNLTRETLRIFWQHALRYKGAVFVLGVGVLVLTGLDIYKPFLYKQFFDQLILISPDNSGPLIKTLLFIFIANIANWLVWRSVLFVNNFFQPRVMYDLLNTCYEYLQDHSYRFFSDNQHPPGKQIKKSLYHRPGFQFTFNGNKKFHNRTRPA